MWSTVIVKIFSAQTYAINHSSFHFRHIDVAHIDDKNQSKKKRDDLKTTLPFSTI